MGVRNELTTVLPATQTDTDFEVFIRIGKFFKNAVTNAGAIGKALKDLDAAMKSNILTKGKWDIGLKGRAAKYWENRVGAKKPPKDDGFSHVLSDVLTNFEVDTMGFNYKQDTVGGPKRAALYLSFVDKVRFRTQLQQLLHWKDPTVSADHGEFTHRIQWYILVSAGVVSPAEARSVFPKTGQYVNANPTTIGSNTKVTETDLWELLFDRDLTSNPNQLYPVAESAADFRCPNYLNTYLIGSNDVPALGSPSQQLPYLHKFLLSRWTKRSSGAVSINDYVAKKLYAGKKFSALQEDEKIEVLTVISNFDQNLLEQTVAFDLDVMTEDMLPDITEVQRLLAQYNMTSARLII